MNRNYAEYRPVTPDTALVMGGSGLPQPGQGYVEAADLLYLLNTFTRRNHRLLPADDAQPGVRDGLSTPEQAYPLFDGGVHQLY